MPPLLDSKQELEAVLPKISLMFSSTATFVPRMEAAEYVVKLAVRLIWPSSSIIDISLFRKASIPKDFTSPPLTLLPWIKDYTALLLMP
jgi:hypothetical protein